MCEAAIQEAKKQNINAIVMGNTRPNDGQEHCDQVVILQHGKKVADRPAKQTSVDEVLKMMM